MPDAVLPTVKSERAAARQLEASYGVGVGEVLPGPSIAAQVQLLPKHQPELAAWWDRCCNREFFQ